MSCKHTIGTAIDEDGCCVSCGADLKSITAAGAGKKPNLTFVCGECGSNDIDTFVDKVDYGQSWEFYAPVRKCKKCDFKWTDWVAEDLFEKAKKKPDPTETTQSINRQYNTALEETKSIIDDGIRQLQISAISLQYRELLTLCAIIDSLTAENELLKNNDPISSQTEFIPEIRLFIEDCEKGLLSPDNPHIADLYGYKGEPALRIAIRWIVHLLYWIENERTFRKSYSQALKYNIERTKQIERLTDEIKGKGDFKEILARYCKENNVAIVTKELLTQFQDDIDSLKEKYKALNDGGVLNRRTFMNHKS